MKKLSKILLISVLSAFLMAGVVVMSATAGPIPASPGVCPAPNCVGESDLTSFVPGTHPDVNIDWMVTTYPGGSPGPLTDFTSGFTTIDTPGYLYLYQVETPTAASGGVPIDAFSVTIPANLFGSVIGAGIIFGDDLDVASALHPAHDAATFAGLAGEEEPAALFNFLGFGVTLVPNTVTWTWPAASPLPTDRESETLYFVSTLPPTYGVGGVQDDSPPSPWGTLAPGGDPVPVPAPEPATMALLGMGLLGLGGLGRKKFSKK